jgi:hypothetical protein
MSYVSTCLADGAVGLYELAEALSSSPAADQAGIQDGVYGNTAGVTLGQAGIPGGGGATACRLVSASSGYVNVADNAAQHVGDTFSLELWLKLATLATQFGLLNATANGAPELLVQSTGKIHLLSKGTSDIGDSVAAIADTTTFHHIVWTKATSTNHIYIDGAVSDGAFTNATLGNSTGWFVGTSDGAYLALDGTVAMVAIYPSALAAATVANHYALGGAAAPAAVSGAFQ